MGKPSHRQLAWRGRIETGLRLAAPVLDLVLAVGERISRSVERDEIASGAPPRTVAPLSEQRRVGPAR